LILPRSIDGVCQSAYCADTEVGSYMVGVRMLEVLTLVPIFFMNSVLPVMTRHIREKSQKLKDIMNYSFYFLLAIGSAGAVGIAILARKITLLLSSKEFLTNDGVYGSDTAIQILMGAMFLCYLANFLGFSIIALGEQKKLLWINFWAVLFNLTSNLWVIPHYGLRGAATTSVISEFIIFTLCFITLKKISPEFTPKLTRVIKILFSSTVMGALVYFFQFSLLLSIGGGMLIFFALLYFTKAITPEMLLILKKK
jgi:O-antigen/teichoic acid export membrane protein